MVPSRRRNPFIRHIQRHMRISALEVGALATAGGPDAAPIPSRAALGMVPSVPATQLQPGLGQERLPAELPTTIPRLQTWNQAGRASVPVVMASLAPTPAPGEGIGAAGGQSAQEEPIGMISGGEVYPAVELGTGHPTPVPPPQDGRLPAGGSADQTHAVMPTPSHSLQAPPERQGQIPAQRTATPVKPPVEPEAGGRSRGEQPAEVESPAPQEDGVWKRLQTIFRKHEEKRREAEAQEETLADQTAAGEEAPENDEAAPEKKDDREPRLASELPEQAAPADAALALGTTSTTHTTNTPHTSATEEPEKQAIEESLPDRPAPIQRTSQEKLAPPGPGAAQDNPHPPQVESAQAESVTDKTNAAVPTRQPVKTLPEPEETRTARTEFYPPQAAAKEEAGAHDEGEALLESAPDGEIVNAPVGQQPGESTAETLQAEDQRPKTVQPLPLEAVWPVQRQSGQPAQQDIFSDEGSGAEKSLSSEKVAAALEILGQEAHAQVREALREVSPGKPSESSVEVITPRRRRPAFEQELGIGPAEKLAPRAQNQTHSIQGIEKEQADIERTAPVPGIESPARDFEPVPEEMVMAPEEIPGIEHRLTEIGPLPVDLWTLIGESPGAAQPQSTQAASPAASGKPVQRESRPPQYGQKMPEALTGFVQRQPAEQSAADSASAGTAGSAGGPEARGGQPQAEIDMDELARRVYGEVKKRLALEWERMRRRL
jgi:hypothetical protein